MAEATDKDSILSLFEPMAQEILRDQSARYPTENPIPPARRPEVINWLLSKDGGGVHVKLLEPFDHKEVRDLLIESMLLNSWFLPDLELANKLPLRGSSTRVIGSSSIPIEITGEEPRKMDVVIKKRNRRNKAPSELKNLQKLADRGIPCVKPLGILEVSDSLGSDIFVLTLLRKGLVPLEKVHFEQLQTGPHEKFKQLRELTKRLGQFVANLHNQGVVHGDLHLGNIAVDLDQGAEFVLYDLERAKILRIEKLRMKNKFNRQYNQSLVQGFKDFEKDAVGDLARLAANITGRNPNINSELILDDLVTSYLDQRQQSLGQYSREQFMSVFNSLYHPLYAKIRNATDWRRKHYPELAE